MRIPQNESKDFLINEQVSPQMLLEQVDGLIYQFQYFPDKKIFNFPFASKGIWNIYEVTPEQVRYDATPALNRVHKDDVKEVYKIMIESMKAMKSWNQDYRVVLPSKGVRWLRGHGLPTKLKDGSILWNGCVMDITEHKRMEVSLLESKERLQFAIESAQDGVWDWNVKTNEVIYSNESKRMLGYESHEVNSTSQTWDNRVHLDDRKAYYEDIKRHFSGETQYYINEHRVKCKDGSYKWILDRGKVIERDENAEVIRVIGTHSDITLQKQREEEAKKTINIIGEQNNRLLNFAHIVSHNLRSHSSNFEILLEMIRETNDEKEKLEMMDHLKNVSDRLSDTIKHLNKIVSVQTDINQELDKINLNDYIEKTINILKGDIDQRKAILVNQVSPEIFIHYNPAYLESILLNLISNALKYKHPDRNPEVRLEVFYENKELILQISDNGIGINLNKHGESLFGMYKTFHGNEDAVGIGLFITKNQIETMGGEIKVESELNVGTRFKILFNQKSI